MVRCGRADTPAHRPSAEVRSGVRSGVRCRVVVRRVLSRQSSESGLAARAVFARGNPGSRAAVCATPEAALQPSPACRVAFLANQVTLITSERLLSYHTKIHAHPSRRATPLSLLSRNTSTYTTASPTLKHASRHRLRFLAPARHAIPCPATHTLNAAASFSLQQWRSKNFLCHMKIYERNLLTIDASNINRAATCPKTASGTPAKHANHPKPCTAH